MNSTFQFIVLLACVVTGMSIVNKRCLCLAKKKKNHEDPQLIVDIKEKHPRPYCSSYEVIAVLKTGGSSCLNPKSNFTRDIVRVFRERKEEATRVKVNDIGRETTTTSSTVSTKSPPTTSSTVSTKSPPTTSSTVSTKSPATTSTVSTKSPPKVPLVF